MAMRAQTERAETGQRATARRPILFRPLAGLVRRFSRDVSGATVVEYTLIAGLTFLAIVGALRYYADRTEAMYQRIGTAVSGAT